MEKKYFSGGLFKVTYYKENNQTYLHCYCFKSNSFCIINIKLFFSAEICKTKNITYGLVYKNSVVIDKNTYIGLKNLIEIMGPNNMDEIFADNIRKYLSDVGYMDIGESKIENIIFDLKRFRITDPILVKLKSVGSGDAYYKNYNNVSEHNRSVMKILIDRSKISDLNCSSMQMCMNTNHMIKMTNHGFKIAENIAQIYMVDMLIELFENTQ